MNKMYKRFKPYYTSLKKVLFLPTVASPVKKYIVFIKKRSRTAGFFFRKGKYRHHSPVLLFVLHKNTLIKYSFLKAEPCSIGYSGKEACTYGLMNLDAFSQTHEKNQFLDQLSRVRCHARHE